jgi:hypothetical protein
MNYKPWIHSDAIDKILEFKNSKSDKVKILEFGSGYSTLFFEELEFDVYSIEHDKIWFNKIFNLLKNKKNYILIDIEYKSCISFDNSFYGKSSLNEIFKIDFNYFDIILIDGINRVNSFFASIDYLKYGGLIILDDSNRIDNPASDGSYKPIYDFCIDRKYKHYKFRSSDRNTDIWEKKV